MTTHAKATYVADSDFTLHVGDVRQVLAQLPAESVHCVVTSPPYWGLRDYGTGVWGGGDPDCDHIKSEMRHGINLAKSVHSTRGGAKKAADVPDIPYGDECGKCGARRVDQQLGLEPTPDLYVQNMIQVFREVRRVLRRDGTCWLNIGDSYAASGGNDRNGSSDGNMGRGDRPDERRRAGLKPKDLVGIPWRLAFALQHDGWYLRSDVIWSKPNPMPESVTDRPTKAHEYLFLLTRSPRYFYDADAIRETTGTEATWDEWKRSNGRHAPSGSKAEVFTHPNGRNRRSVWEIATEPYPDAHFATFPQALVEPCILAGTSERGCCPECGAPWERETARESYITRPTVGRDTQKHKTGDQGANGLERIGGHAAVRVETIGWRPTCDCHGSRDECRALGHEPCAFPSQPCVVLDPFMGSGTTALVARRFGRKSIGIELNEEYARLCAHRLRQLSLLA